MAGRVLLRVTRIPRASGWYSFHSRRLRSRLKSWPSLFSLALAASTSPSHSSRFGASAWSYRQTARSKPTAARTIAAARASHRESYCRRAPGSWGYAGPWISRKSRKNVLDANADSLKDENVEKLVAGSGCGMRRLKYGLAPPAIAGSVERTAHAADRPSA